MRNTPRIPKYEGLLIDNFLTSLEELILSLGGKKVEKGGTPSFVFFKLPTIFGDLELAFSRTQRYGYHLTTKFDSPTLIPTDFVWRRDINRYSGKWNFFEPKKRDGKNNKATRKEALKQLLARFERDLIPIVKYKMPEHDFTIETLENEVFTIGGNGYYKLYVCAEDDISFLGVSYTDSHLPYRTPLKQLVSFLLSDIFEIENSSSYDMEKAIEVLRTKALIHYQEKTWKVSVK